MNGTGKSGPASGNDGVDMARMINVTAMAAAIGVPEETLLDSLGCKPKPEMKDMTLEVLRHQLGIPTFSKFETGWWAASHFIEETPV